MGRWVVVGFFGRAGAADAEADAAADDAPPDELDARGAADSIVGGGSSIAVGEAAATDVCEAVALGAGVFLRPVADATARMLPISAIAAKPANSAIGGFGFWGAGMGKGRSRMCAVRVDCC